IGQYIFYKEAVQSSPEVFKDINKLESFDKILENEDYSEAFKKLDKTKFESLPNGKKLLTDLDQNIEARARHYTSNLTKIGFAYNNRQITPVGKLYLNEKISYFDDFEKLLPINSINLILLRQLAKLRIYSSDGSKYYSPMNLLLYILLKYETVSDSILFKIIELLNPKFPVDPDLFLSEVFTTNFEEVQLSYNNRISGDDNTTIPKNIMQFREFSKYFTSQKDSDQIKVYYDFYLRNYIFNLNKTQKNLDKLIELLKDSKSGPIIKTAFGGKSAVYNLRKTRLEDFLSENEDRVFLTDGINNSMYYSEFKFSKRNSDVREYNRNFRKVVLATGIVHSKNGIAELAFKSLWSKFFDIEQLKDKIFVASSKECMESHELSYNSDFYKNITLSQIYKVEAFQLGKIIQEIIEELSVSNVDEVKQKLKSTVALEFEKFVQENFPKEKVLEILPLFSNRNNDKIIQKMVGVDSSVPTIFEYIVGLVWYHLSDKKYDLYSSFNLTMTADFLPEKFAGGGYGDIVVRYKDEIVQIEVTLMDKNSQKRGEWEPVLRHATNLTIDEEPIPVTTLFVADELDENTINIWRAIATVPLQSSRVVQTKGRRAENVKIMPLKNMELLMLINNNVTSSQLLTSIRNSFSALPQEFDLHWRESILEF
ncbi:AlwI family type II restriction endonuclease, partial [Streptococcus suis]